jgi:hypothetical protein
MKALQNCVPEERIATTLNIDLAAIRHNRGVLNGVCPVAAKLLPWQRSISAAIRFASALVNRHASGR